MCIRDSGKPVSQERAVDMSVLEGHVGFYQLNENAVFTIARNGRQLNAQLTGQPVVPIHARGNTEFSYKDGWISFIAGSDGASVSLILHQHGVDIPMKRIDAASAARIASIAVARRYGPKLDRIGAWIILQ